MSRCGNETQVEIGFSREDAEAFDQRKNRTGRCARDSFAVDRARSSVASGADQAEERVVQNAIARRIFAPSYGTRSNRISRTLRHRSRRVVDTIAVPHDETPTCTLVLFLRSLGKISRYLPCSPFVDTLDPSLFPCRRRNAA